MHTVLVYARTMNLTRGHKGTLKSKKTDKRSLRPLILGVNVDVHIDKINEEG